MTNLYKKSFFQANGLAIAALALPALMLFANPASASTVTFSNPTPISIVDLVPANPYPSSINVSGFTGLTSKVTVTLFGLSHTFPDDLDILLVGPTGLHTILMSDAGFTSDIANVTLTFDDAASASLPNSTLISSGSYLPSNFGTLDLFAGVPVTGPYEANPLSVFNTANPNGVWSLYVLDDGFNDTGSIAGGWSLNITADTSASTPNVPEPSMFLLFTTGLLTLAARRSRKSV